MRILYLADAPYIHTRRVVQHFAGLGHDCEVISFRPAEIDGVQVTYVEGFERLGKVRYLLHARRVGRLVRERAPDVLHALHLTSYGFLGALSGYHPYVISAWGTDILEAPHLTPLHNWLTKYSLARADEITATGDDLALQTQRYVPVGKLVHSVPYGVDLSAFVPVERLASPKPVVGTAARLSGEKGVEYLLDAFDRLDLCDNAVLRIAGDGPERAKLEARAQTSGWGDSVRFEGWLDHERLPEFLRSLDMFVLPSLYEGFGVAAVEASACGLPVVASRINGIPDVVVDGETGILVPPKDPDALASAIESLVHDPERRKAMGEAGRAFVASRYNWAQNMAGLEAIYESLAGRTVGANR
ncbi:MAG TPA: glycosyltransferase [Dehalococcoidia bacterium]|jgi:glycosyltransferase involved in cell wall biosynthesis